MNYNLTVFYESFLNASIIPFSNDATFASMAAFGGFDLKVPAMLAIIGGTLGLTFNLMIGMLVLHFYKRGKLYISPYWYEKISRFFNTYLLWSLLFSSVSILKLLPLFAGALGTRARYALPLMLIGEMYHYGSYLL